MEYRVYVIQNLQGKFYIDISEDVVIRVQQHNNGRSRWTKGKGPWTLKWTSEAMSIGSARKLENLLKRQKRGAGFHKLTGLLPSQAHNPANAGSWVQIPPPQPP